jgi:hypothetical protein
LFKNTQDKTLSTEGVTLRNKTPLADFLKHPGEDKNAPPPSRNPAILFKKVKTKPRVIDHMRAIGETGCQRVVADRQGTQHLANLMAGKTVRAIP